MTHTFDRAASSRKVVRQAFGSGARGQHRVTRH
jgi:hypothetical protein